MNYNEWWQCTKHGAVSLPEHVHSILVVHKDPEVTSYCQVSTGNCAVIDPGSSGRNRPILIMGRKGLHNHPESVVGAHGVDSVVFPQYCNHLLYVLFTPVLGPKSPGLPVPPEEKLVG